MTENFNDEGNKVFTISTTYSSIYAQTFTMEEVYSNYYQITSTIQLKAMFTDTDTLGSFYNIDLIITANNQHPGHYKIEQVID
jgi:hypothetical protein